VTKRLSDYAFGQAVDFMNVKARPLERAMLAYEFGQGSAETVVEELIQYRNEDGGFGYGLEPDLRTAASSAYATTIAMQYLVLLPDEAAKEPAEEALAYFRSTYDAAGQGWDLIPEAAEEAPRAPWWGYESVRTRPHWGNANAEIAGYFLRYGSESDRNFAEALTETAIQKLEEVKQLEFHELLCYLRLARFVASEQYGRMEPWLQASVQSNVVTDPAKWTGYGLQPIKVVTSPDSPYADMLSEAVQANLDFAVSKQTPEGCWMPEWSWGQDEKEWAEAHTEWCGVLTLEKLRVLKAFGRIERYS
jgi:hypothetical protein